MTKRARRAIAADEAAWAPTRAVLTTAAVICACGFGVLLGLRPLSSADLGYHLAYGDAFWDSGRIVDHNPFIYTLPKDVPPDQRPEPGPGCWYDRAGRYRFPNANWLSQAIMAGVHRLAGAYGLSALRALLIAGIFAISLRTLRNLKVPWSWASAGVLLMALASYGRFRLRPELFGFLVLVAQLCILTRRAEDPSSGRWRLGWPAAAALIFLQLLQVNMHSYFLLGLALTAAVLADRGLYLYWQRSQRRPAAGGDPALRQSAGRLAVVLIGQVAVSFVNPWTWRLAVLPVQTLLFIRRNDVTALGGAHPWAFIGEFFGPFAAPDVWGAKVTWAYVALLVLAAVAALAAVLKRRWASLFILGGMAAVSLSMRRNIPPAAMVMTPLAVAAGRAAIQRLSAVLLGPLRKVFSMLGLAMIAAASVWLGFCVVTQRFYYGENESDRFGAGFSASQLPLAGAAWLNEHQPPGPMWTDYHSSSHWHFLTRPHRDVPALTNTWAYPPETMGQVLDYCRTRLPFQQAAERYSLQIAALRADSCPALVTALSGDARWTLVHIDGLHLIFLRSQGPNAKLAGRFAISPQSLDIGAYAERMAALDPVQAYGLFVGGRTLYALRWHDQAIELLQTSLAVGPEDPKVLFSLGLAYGQRGQELAIRKEDACLDYWQQSRRCFETALKIRPGDGDARRNLELVNRLISHYKAGRPPR